MAKNILTYEEIMKGLKAKNYAPIYYLMGEESYYIDQISNYITDNILTDSEKEFNLTVMYGTDITQVADVINAAKRYPMMSEYQVVVVREAQGIRDIENLVYYVQRPLKSTILVLCHKHGTLDRRKKLTAEIAKNGVLFESKPIRENMLPSFISTYMRGKGATIDEKATIMMIEFVGSDLSRLIGELEKLIITLPEGQKRVTPELVEKNIGISKDFNNFELKNALINRNVLKANEIIKYFEKNQKANPIQMTLGFLFSFFSNLMLTYYAPQKNQQGITDMLDLRSTWAAKDYITAMNKYSGKKTMEIIGAIRYADAKSKGIENSSQSSFDILRELVYKIMH
ncbi:MAG: DNA polymerase III subunit delta [Bacteroidaceae bacterium]